MKPNMLFLHYDSMRASALSCYGNPFVRTPNHDRLAKMGVVFDNCFTQNPVCSPSRCSMMTGYYLHTFGHRTLWQLLRTYEPSLFRYMKQAGYQVVNYGQKNDLYSQDYLEEVYDNIEELRKGFTPRTAYRDDLRGKNPYSQDDPRYYSFVLDPIPDDRSQPPALYKAYAGALDFIEDWQPEDKPFMLYMSVNPPHPPYTCLERFYNMYDPETLRDYITPKTGLKGAPSYVNYYQKQFATDQFGDDYPSRICAIYHGMVSYMDYVLGRLLDSLEQKNLLESTVIVVTSDHGDWAGNRGLFEKNLSAYEDDMLHVPLLISAPGLRRGLNINGQVELFDIMPTLLDLADIPCTHDHFAVSLLPELRGERDDTSRVIFSEGGVNDDEIARWQDANLKDGIYVPGNPYYRNYMLTKDKPRMVRRGVCIRTPEYKLVRRENDENELYSLKDDPREINNLYGDISMNSIRMQLEEMLLRWYLRTGDAAPLGRDPRGWIRRW